MRGLIFVGMLGPDSHNPEERRFVEELAGHFDQVHYLRGIGIKGLRPHQLASIPSRITDRRRKPRGDSPIRIGSLRIVPLRFAAARLNIAWLRRQLEKMTQGAPREWTLWTRFPSPELVSAVLDLPFGQVVYEPIDRYVAAPNFSTAERERMATAEARLIERATVVTGGRGLAEQFRMAAGGSHWLPFGQDLDNHSDGPGLPAEIGRPRLGVVGRLDWRLDEPLLVGLMTRHLEWRLVLVGPRAQPWGSDLERLQNVHWLGLVPSERVRSLIAGCDVTLIPYRLSEWTRACLPVKLFDYLGEGKPVVATPLSELAPFADVVTLAPPDQFDVAVERALAETTPQAADSRRRAASRFTIQDRARRAAALLAGMPRQALAR